jgi:hypothetical protein
VRLRELARESFPDDKLAAEIAMRKAFDAKEAYFRGAGGDALILLFTARRLILSDTRLIVLTLHAAQLHSADHKRTTQIFCPIRTCSVAVEVIP